MVAIAARPEAKAKPALPLSRSATQRSNAMRVGFLRARIFVALVHARALLHVGRGRVDRHHHRAGGRIGLLPGMDAAGGEVEPVRLVIGLFAVIIP